MSRPPPQGDAAVDRDVQSLVKIKRRITLDQKRTPGDRKKLEALLVEAITLLLNTKRDVKNMPHMNGAKTTARKRAS